MIASVAGIGCVTPLGQSLESIWESMEAGKRAPVTAVINPENGRSYAAARIPSTALAPVNREARLRRSSTISLLAALAGTAAMKEASAKADSVEKDKLAVVLGVSSGGVQYTRRFYEQVIRQGANSASPLLFPETVYNAPASHLSALLGVTGASYTVVGDGTVGMQALELGTQLLATGEAEEVLVVAAEELDWILFEAHHDWRLAGSTAEPRVQSHPRTGALLAEGAAALLLRNKPGGVQVRTIKSQTFFSRQDARQVTGRLVCEALAGGLNVDVVVSGANGTWVDEVVENSLRDGGVGPEVRRCVPKEWMGEALGAGALIQAALAVGAIGKFGVERALALSVGWNQQACAVVVERASDATSVTGE